MKSAFLPVKYPGLFRSAAWLRAWLAAWGDHPNVCLSEKSVSWSAPISTTNDRSFMYLVNEPLFKVLPVLTAYPIGISSKLVPSIRGEYFQIENTASVGVSACLDYIDHCLATKWDRIIFPDILVGSTDFVGLVNAAKARNLYLVQSGHEDTYGVNLTLSTFSEYVKTLGKNTRLKFFNSRKKLEQYGAVAIENIWPDRNRFFELLNEFHVTRWGRPCYADRNEVFINTLLDELPATGAQIHFSVMTVSSKPVSVAFDIVLDGRVYNLQAGYAEDFAKGIALGTLHLGYQIEAAFADDNTDYYDFMAGRGKNSNYKKSIANSSAEFVKLTLVRSRWLMLAYKLHAWVKKIRNK